MSAAGGARRARSAGGRRDQAHYAEEPRCALGEAERHSLAAEARQLARASEYGESPENPSAIPLCVPRLEARAGGLEFVGDTAERLHSEEWRTTTQGF